MAHKQILEVTLRLNVTIHSCSKANSEYADTNSEHQGMKNPNDSKKKRHMIHYTEAHDGLENIVSFDNRTQKAKILTKNMRVVRQNINQNYLKVNSEHANTNSEHQDMKNPKDSKNRRMEDYNDLENPTRFEKCKRKAKKLTKNMKINMRTQSGSKVNSERADANSEHPDMKNPYNSKRNQRIQDYMEDHNDLDNPMGFDDWKRKTKKINKYMKLIWAHLRQFWYNLKLKWANSRPKRTNSKLKWANFRLKWTKLRLKWANLRLF